MRVQDEIARIEDMPYGEERTRRAQDLLRQVQDEGRTTKDEYEARVAVITSGLYSGESEMVLLHLPWILNEHDKDPSLGPEFHLVWYYKWFLSHAVDVPGISLERLQELLDDYQRRAHKLRFGAQAHAKLRWSIAWHTGAEAAPAQHQRWKSTKRDPMSDCKACDPSHEASWLLSQGDHQGALDMLQPLLDGDVTCTAEPEESYATAALAAYHLGHHDEARRLHLRGYHLIYHNRDFLLALSRHMRYLALSGDTQRALQLHQRHKSWVEQNRLPPLEVTYLGALGALVEALDRQGALATLRLPGDTDDTVGAQALREKIQERALRITRLYDQRNHNTYQSDKFLQHVQEATTSEHTHTSPAAPPTPRPARPGQ